MRRIALTLFVFATFCFAEAAYACGDKFLLVGRGGRYQRAYVARHPASILLLTSTAATSRPELRSALKKAGHRVRAVATLDEFEGALRSGRYDIVLADVAVADSLERQVAEAPSQPMLLPVTSGAARPTTAAVPETTRCTFRMEKKQRQALAIVDAAMDLRLNGKPISCSATPGK